MWHNLTNHPAHQPKPDSATPTPNTSDPPPSKKDLEEEPKKASGSGSG